MARYGANTHVVSSDTSSGIFVVENSFTHPRKILITDIDVIGHNPADTDGDTIAIDVSYSTDGFSSSDVEITALAAVEYNDTDNTAAFVAEIPNAQTLTAANTSTWGDDTVVAVPAGANVKTTITWTGAPADGNVDVVITYVPV